MRISSYSLIVSLIIGLLGSIAARAGTPLGFPKDSPEFTFELPDNMQSEYQSDGKLSCTAKDGSLGIRGVFLALPNISNDKGLLIGLTQLIKLVGPQHIQSDLRYQAPFYKDTSSGVPTVTVSCTGKVNGQDYAIALICFSKNGKYYELIASGSIDAMTACHFPKAFRETMKLTP